MSISLINYFIKTRVGKEALNHGWDLLDGGKIKDFFIHEDGRTAEAVVQDGEDYTVLVTDFRNMNIDVNCNCIAYSSSVCSHSTAALLRLISELDGKRLSKAPSRKTVKRNSSKPLQLDNFEKLTNSALSRYLMRDDMYFSTQLIKKISLANQGLIFNISAHFDDFEYITSFFREDGKYYSHCTCDQSVRLTCEHERAVINAMIGSGRKVLTLFEENKQEKMFRTICQANDIPDKYATTEYIRINIDERFNVRFTFHGPLEGLIGENTIYDDKPWYDFFGDRMKLRNKSIQQLFRPAEDKKTAVGFVFLFERGLDKGVDYVQPISGKVNKTGNKLTSNIRHVTVADLPALTVSEKEREGIILCEQMNGVDNTDLDLHDGFEMLALRNTHEQLRRLYGLLAGNPLVYELKDDDEGIRKANLQPVSVSPEPVDFGARLESDADFISLIPHYSIGEQVFDFGDDALIRRSGLTWFYNNDLHLIRNVTMLDAINFMEVNPIIKSLLSKTGEFIAKVVVPFSERFDIDIEGLRDFETDEIFLKPIKKQVFLSEFKGYILFTPLVVYNHKKEAEVMTGGNFIEQVDGQLRIYNRNEDYEQEFLKFLRGLHTDFVYQEQERSVAIALEEMLKNNWFFDAFEAMKKNGIEVLGLQKLKSFKYSPYRATVNTGIKSGQDWFDVQVEVSFGEHKIPLTKLKKHILNKEKFIRLGDGTVGMLPDEWIGKLEKYFRAGEIKDDEIKVSKLRFGIIDELFEQIDDTEILHELAEKRQRLAQFTEISKIKKPATIKATLRDYQKEGLNWLNFLDEMGWGGILADDMGLGKTLQILAFLASLKRKRPKTSLVVVPTTLIFNWQNEIEKFYPSLKVLFYYGSKKNREAKDFKSYNLVVTTYGLMVNDIEAISKVKFNYVILDESQAIKNPLSKRYKAACLLQGKNKLTLTGTPIENNTFDLFAQMSFANPGLLGTQKSFKDQYSSPIDKEKDPGRANELRKIISPFVLRRTKEQVATELPPKTEDVIYCQMDHQQRAVYEDYKNKYRAYILNKIDKDGMGKSKMSILEGLLKLRQICNSPRLMGKQEDIPDESIKLEELMRQINEKTGAHKIVVFSQFVKMLKLIEKELQHEGMDYEYFDGSSSQKRRKESVSRFQEDEKCRLFLISLKAGGTGINLTAADYVYIFDPWWNPAVENQAIDRTYRIGQDKKVFAYRMICKDTVEEKIMKYQEQKKALAADIIRTDESFVKQLNKESIMDLFG